MIRSEQDLQCFRLQHLYQRKFLPAQIHSSLLQKLLSMRGQQTNSNPMGHRRLDFQISALETAPQKQIKLQSPLFQRTCIPPQEYAHYERVLTNKIRTTTRAASITSMRPLKSSKITERQEKKGILEEAPLKFIKQEINRSKTRSLIDMIAQLKQRTSRKQLTDRMNMTQTERLTFKKSQIGPRYGTERKQNRQSSKRRSFNQTTFVKKPAFFDKEQTVDPWIVKDQEYL